jgi:hypothetical protein
MSPEATTCRVDRPGQDHSGDDRDRARFGRAAHRGANGTVPPTIAESLWLIRRGQTDAEGQGRVAYLKREMVKGLPI